MVGFVEEAVFNPNLWIYCGTKAFPEKAFYSMEPRKKPLLSTKAKEVFSVRSARWTRELLEMAQFFDDGIKEKIASTVCAVDEYNGKLYR